MWPTLAGAGRSRIRESSCQPGRNGISTEQTQKDLKIHRIDTEHEIPAWTSRDEIATFFHEQMKPYHDRVEDIQRGLTYAFSERPSEGGFLLLAVIEERIVGALLMLRTGMKGYIPENLLLFVGVHPDMRGRGLGTRIIERAFAEVDGDIKLHVEPDNPAKRLYERLGFTNPYAEMRWRNVTGRD